MAAILKSAMLDSDMLHIFRIQANSILTQTHLSQTSLKNGSHLKVCHCWTLTLQTCIQIPCYLQTQIHSELNYDSMAAYDLKLMPSWIQPSYSFSSQTWWWQPSWILQDWIPAICTKINFTDCILTQLDDGNHLEFCHLGFSHFAQKNFTCLFRLNFIMAAILNSAILDSTILHKKISLVHSDSTWWWQPSDLFHVGFRHCHLGFRHLIIYCQIHSKTLSLHSDSDSN